MTQIEILHQLIAQIEIGNENPSKLEQARLLGLKQDLRDLRSHRTRMVLYKGADWVGYVWINDYDTKALKGGASLGINRENDGFTQGGQTGKFSLFWGVVMGRISINTNVRIGEIPYTKLLQFTGNAQEYM